MNTQGNQASVRIASIASYFPSCQTCAPAATEPTRLRSRSSSTAWLRLGGFAVFAISPNIHNTRQNIADLVATLIDGKQCYAMMKRTWLDLIPVPSKSNILTLGIPSLGSFDSPVPEDNLYLYIVLTLCFLFKLLLLLFSNVVL